MKRVNKDQVIEIISQLQADAEKAHDLAVEWEGSGITYADTDKLAEDVEYGRHIGLLEAAEQLNKLLFTCSENIEKPIN